MSAKLVSRLLPGFQNGHTTYVQYVKSVFKDNCRWLDAGGGRKIFHDGYDGERELVRRSQTVVVCDADAHSLNNHFSVSRRVYCSLSSIPLPSNSFDFITCAMVAEHLEDPPACFKELARLLDEGGRLVIHTVNLWGYHTLLALLSKIIPPGLRAKLIAKLTGRAEEDIFPTYYRCNTPRKMRELLREAGLEVEEIRLLHPGFLFRSVPPLLLIELAYVKLISGSALKNLRGQLLVTATKPRTAATRPASPFTPVPHRTPVTRRPAVGRVH